MNAFDMKFATNPDFSIDYSNSVELTATDRDAPILTVKIDFADKHKIEIIPLTPDGLSYADQMVIACELCLWFDKTYFQ